MSKFTKAAIEDIIWGHDPDFNTIVDGEWINEYKDCELKETIVQQVSTGKYYMINQSRSGSYYSDYFYDDPEITEVEKVVKMIETTTWESV